MTYQEYNHIARNIPNTKANRDQIKELNKLAKKSESMHRFKIKYKRPFPVSEKPDSQGWYPGGGCRKEDAQYFSVYIDITQNQQERIMEHQHHEREREIKQEEKKKLNIIDIKEKYDLLKDKYNKLVLKEIVNDLLNDVKEIQIALDNNININELIRSIGGVILDTDILLNETIEQ